MTRDEAKTILMTISKMYSSFKCDDYSSLIDLWAIALANDDFEAIQMSLMNYFKTDTSGYAPSPGQLREGAIQMAEPEYDDTEDMVALIRKAVANSTYNSRAMFDRLPPLVQKTVGSPDNLRSWAMLSSDEFENVQLSHFRKAYRANATQSKQQAKLKPIDDERMLKIRENLKGILGESRRNPQITE